MSRRDQDRSEKRSLSQIAVFLEKNGVTPAFVEQTGGGVATLFAEFSHNEDGYGDRYKLVAGPGWFEAGEGFIDFGDFAYGPDDDGESSPLYITEGSEEEIAGVFFAYVRGIASTCPRCGGKLVTTGSGGLQCQAATCAEGERNG